MLNNQNERELAYVVRIDDIVDTGIPNVRNKLAIVNGWQVFVRPNDFNVGDLAVYFEIDSLCPDTDIFDFLKDKHRIKTQKYIKGQVLSQGLLMRVEDCKLNHPVQLGDFLTQELGVTYYDEVDKKNKLNDAEIKKIKLDKMIRKFAKRHPYLSKNRLICYFYEKYAVWAINKSKTAKKSTWPAWVEKTDEERVQNLPWLFNLESERRTELIKNKFPLFATEKIDGTSTTFTMKQAKPQKRELLVCSRNVVFNNPNKKSYYDDTDGNVYVEMARKYNIEELMNRILNDHKEYEFITIQGETYGGNIQKRNYGSEHRFATFNVIYKEKNKAPVRLNPREMQEFLKQYGDLPTVPIVDEDFQLPATCDELLTIAEGMSAVDGGDREGLVFRSSDGQFSFKAVSNSFLMKYHG